MASLNLHASDRPLLMGILNVTPDSFSDGGLHLNAAAAIEHADQMVSEGAELIDVGGESTRPGAQAVSAAEQIRRTQPVISAIRHRHPKIPISIDTQLAEVAHAAIEAGAVMVNDISALRADGDMVRLLAKTKVHVVLMHMQGTPRNMQGVPHYDDVVAEIAEFLQERLEFAVSNGIERADIVIDPGIGFGKTVRHNLQILAGLQRFVEIAPVLLGTSRKSFIGRILGIDDPRQRGTGTTVTHTIGLLAGVRIIRTHDIRQAKQTIDLCSAVTSIIQGGGGVRP